MPAPCPNGSPWTQLARRRRATPGNRLNMNNSRLCPFRLAFTADFYDETGQPKFAELGLSVFDSHSHVKVSRFPSHLSVVEPSQLAGAHGVIVLTPRVTRDSIAGCKELLAIGRFGV